MKTNHESIRIFNLLIIFKHMCVHIHMHKSTQGAEMKEANYPFLAYLKVLGWWKITSKTGNSKSLEKHFKSHWCHREHLPAESDQG